MIAICWKEELAAKDGGAGLIRILIAVVNGEEEVTVIVFRALVVDVVTSIQDEVGWRELRDTGDREIRSVIYQLSDTRFIVHDDRGAGIGHHREIALIAGHDKRKIVAPFAGTEGRGEGTV